MEISDQTFRKEEIKRTFRSYVSMIERCCFPDPRHEGRYAKLSIHKPWLKSFEVFLEDMGPRTEDTTLDRVDNNRGYSPDNCRWATAKEQNRNRSNSHMVKYQGEQILLIELCERLGKDYEIVRGRLKIGMPLEGALQKPKRFTWSKIKVGGKEVNINEYYRQHKEVLDALGLNSQSIRERLRNGWSFEKATTEPVRRWASERKKIYRGSKRYHG